MSDFLNTIPYEFNVHLTATLGKPRIELPRHDVRRNLKRQMNENKQLDFMTDNKYNVSFKACILQQIITF